MIREIDRPESLEEVWLLQKLELLHKEYEREREPYLQRLVQIRAMRVPSRFVVDPSLLDPASGVRIGGAAL